MPSLYYKQEYEIGNGKKLGVVFVDSCLMLCSNFSYTGEELASKDLQRLQDVVCDDPIVTQWGNVQYAWLEQVMKEWEHDDNLIWKASVQHHPMWGKWYPDFQHIVDNYLPML